jgi:hypothetical protein
MADEQPEKTLLDEMHEQAGSITKKMDGLRDLAKELMDMEEKGVVHDIAKTLDEKNKKPKNGPKP